MGLQMKGARIERRRDEVDGTRMLRVAHVGHGEPVAEHVADKGVTLVHHDLDAIAAPVLVAVADPMYLARGIARKLKETNEHHAGELEVSQVYYKFPRTIKPEKFSAAQCDFEGVFGPFGNKDLFGGGGDYIEQPWTSAEQREMAPTGQFSSNAAASQEKGKQYHDYMVARLVEFLTWWQTQSGPLGRKLQ